MELKIVFVILAVTLVSRCSGHGTGTPPSGCATMFPGHNVDAQTIDPPYTITVNAEAYTLEGSLEVTVAGNGDQMYAGIFVQARVADCSGDKNDAPQGTFEITNEETELKLVTCGSTESALTHTSTAAKATKTFTWKAPATDVGTIYFRATVAESMDVFWTQLSSGFIKSPSDDPGNLDNTTLPANETTTETPIPNTTMGVERINISFLFVLFCSVITLLGFC